MNTVFILGETINGENPATSSEKESAPKVEPKIVSYLLTAVTFFFSSPSVFSFLKYALHLSVYVMCAKSRFQLSIYTNPNMTKIVPGTTSTRRA